AAVHRLLHRVRRVDDRFWSGGAQPVRPARSPNCPFGTGCVAESSKGAMCALMSAECLRANLSGLRGGPMRRVIRLLSGAAFAIVTLGLAPAATAAADELKVGDQAPDFTLPGSDGK